MALKQVFRPDKPEEFKLKALNWASQFNSLCYLESNGYRDAFSKFDALIAAGAKRFLQANQNALKQLEEFLKDQHSYVPGFISYDIKNEIEQLSSALPDGLQFPELYFFIPQHLLIFKGGEVEIEAEDPKQVWDAINQFDLPHLKVDFKGSIKSRFSRDEYLASVKGLQEHIKRGDIYEINFCQEFYAEAAEINPLAAFIELNRISPTPFANFFKVNDQYIISATPERFLARRADRLITQPIKGTAKRSTKPSEDEQIKQQLSLSKKEQSENVMIVDLVRNDLSRCALPGSVTVDELFGIYSFKQVHQMISTVSCRIAEQTPFSQILQSTFPMGSMTGAPKIRAMQLTEAFERSKRGIYSGSVGYIAPNGDFDFNVIIRTILYNANQKYLSYQVGGAITHQAKAEDEYEECLLKAKAIGQLLQNHAI